MLEFQTLTLVADIFFVLFLLVFIFLGYKNGFLYSIIQCLGWFLAFLLAWLFAPSLAKILTIYPLAITPMGNTPIGPFIQAQINELVWFILIVIVIKLLSVLLKPLAKAFNHLPIIGFVNSILGALFGAVNMWIWTSIIVLILQLPVLDRRISFKEVVNNSLLKTASVVTDIVLDRLDIDDQDLANFSQLLFNTRDMSDEQVQSLSNWLSSNGINQEQLNDFFDQMGLSNETEDDKQEEVNSEEDSKNKGND